MVSRTVIINKIIPEKELEGILIDAAKDVGLKAKPIQNYTTKYKLGSVKEVSEPFDRTIRLRSILPFAEIKLGFLYSEGFGISTFPHTDGLCVATKKELENYLEAVSKRVEEYQPQAA